MNAKKLSILIIILLSLGGFIMPPIKGDTTTETIQITSPNDDFYALEGAAQTGTNIIIFRHPDLLACAYLRFTNLGINRNSTLTSAILSVYRGTNEIAAAGGLYSTVVGILEPDCSQLIPEEGPIQTVYPETGNVVIWNTQTFNTGWHNVSITNIVDEIIHQYEWEAGNDLGILIRSGIEEEITRAFWSYEYAPGLSAKLYLIYEDVPGPGQGYPDDVDEGDTVTLVDVIVGEGNETIYIWKIESNDTEETVYLGSGMTYTAYSNQHRVLISDYTQRVYVFASNATGTYYKSRPLSGIIWSSWKLFLSGTTATFDVFDVNFSPDGSFGWYLRLASPTLYARRFDLSGDTHSWSATEQNLGTAPGSGYTYINSPVVGISHGGYPFMGMLAQKTGQVYTIHALYSERLDGVWDNAVNSPYLVQTSSAVYILKPTFIMAIDENDRVRYLFSSFRSDNNNNWGEKNFDATNINGAWTTGSSFVLTPTSSDSVYVSTTAIGDKTFLAITNKNGTGTDVHVYQITGTAPTRVLLDKRRFYNATVVGGYSTASKTFTGIYADDNEDLVWVVGSEIEPQGNYWRIRVNGTFYPTSALNFQNFTTGRTFALLSRNIVRSNLGNNNTYLTWIETAPTPRIVIKKLLTGVLDPVGFVGNTSWIITDVNGTTIWTGPDEPDDDVIDDLIDDVIDDPGEDVGPFSRFKMRLYFLVIGLFLFTGPILFLATRPEGAIWYLVAPVVMLIGVAIMASIIGI